MTRIKYIPTAADDPSLSEIERTMGAELSTAVAVTTLSRMWQMLLKGIPETENSSRPAGAAEMVLIRLAHAANLPSPEDAARRVSELLASGNGGSPALPGGSGGGARASLGGSGATASAPVARAIETPQARATGGQPVARLQAVASTNAEDGTLGRVEAKPQANVAAEPKVNVRRSTIFPISALPIASRCCAPAFANRFIL